MRLLLVLSAGMALLLAGCAHPARVTSSFEFAQQPAGRAAVTLRVKNEDDRATTPLAIEVTMEFEHGDRWSKPALVLHPAAFVLKAQEQQILHATFKTDGTAVRAKLTIREQESGRVVLTKTLEHTLGS